ncbi:sporulation membrane protein YtaF [Paenibacillus dakarensis]|uniref:sporulation membrane protein YtaF n=1 Tax=Paenibacillus dakarensis TaxID=1527293 RepID=UPI0006D58A12|nr:sporulation membrane protein YtaF [Paenibacillus dakarensis]
MLSLFYAPALLAMALSLDGFGAGITYGLRKTKIPLLSVYIISLCSGFVLGISMQAGVLLQRVISPSIASYMGAIILIMMGCWSFIQQIRSKSNPLCEEKQILTKISNAEHTVSGQGSVFGQQMAVFSLEIRKLGLVIQILRSPSRADMDDSGSISSWEAMWLGIALSLDAFGAGLGAAMLGLSPWLTSLFAALFSGVFLVLGMKVGFRFASRGGMKYISYLPAILLIFMGIMKL